MPKQGMYYAIDNLLGSLLLGLLPDLDTSVAGEVKLTLAPTLVPNLPIATFQAALSVVGFNTTSSDTSDRNLEITATDANGNATTAEATVGINLPNNESLTVDLDGNDNNTIDGKFNSTFIIGGSGVAIADTDVVVSDSDNPNLALDSIEVVLTNAQGEMN